MFIKVDAPKQRKSLTVSIGTDVLEELDRYVQFCKSQEPKVEKPFVVQELLREALKRDKEFKAFKVPQEMVAKKARVA